MKKTEREYSEWIDAVVKKWQPRLKLDQFEIRNEKDPEQKHMACRYNYPYLTGVILWTDSSFQAWAKGDKVAEHKVIHEMCHLVTDPFYTKAVMRYIEKESLEDERERLTDHVALIVQNAWK